jgi:hypothetical protein
LLSSAVLPELLFVRPYAQTYIAVDRLHMAAKQVLLDIAVARQDVGMASAVTDWVEFVKGASESKMTPFMPLWSFQPGWISVFISIVFSSAFVLLIPVFKHAGAICGSTACADLGVWTLFTRGMILRALVIIVLFVGGRQASI